MIYPSVAKLQVAIDAAHARAETLPPEARAALIQAANAGAEVIAAIRKAQQEEDNIAALMLMS